MPISAKNPFKGRQYSGEVILTAVRWYLRYPLAYEHVSELLAERGLMVDASFSEQLHLLPEEPLATGCGKPSPVPLRSARQWILYA